MKLAQQDGFTIPELILTIVFLGVVSLAVSQIFIGIGNLQGRTSRLESATHAARTEIESLRNNNYNQLAAGSTIDFTSQLPDNLPGKQGSVSISEPTAGLKRVDVTVSYKDDHQTRQVKLSSLIGIIGISQ